MAVLTMNDIKCTAMETADRKGGHVQSVDRAVTVLEFLGRRGWARVTEVANELDIHKSTAYRLLTTLRDRGMVEQSAVTEKYRLGFGLVLLASAVTADLDIVRCARPVCERLSEGTQETVTVAVLEGDDAVVVINLSGRGDKDVATAAAWFDLIEDEPTVQAAEGEQL